MNQLSERINEAENLIHWLDRNIDGVEIHSDLRSRLAGGCLDVALEHQKSIVLLVVNQLYGSAFSLVRLIFEAYIRGVWLHRCASDAGLKQFQNNNFKREFHELIADVEKLEAFKIGVLSEAKRKSWSAMNSFTHSGFHQVVRRNTETTIEPDYSEAEILEATDFANAIALLSAIEIAHLGGNELLANAVLEKAEHFLSG